MTPEEDSSHPQRDQNPSVESHCSTSFNLTPPSLSAAPPKSLLCNILSWTHLLLLSLGLGLLLLVVVSVIGSQSGLQGREESQPGGGVGGGREP